MNYTYITWYEKLCLAVTIALVTANMAAWAFGPWHSIPMALLWPFLGGVSIWLNNWSNDTPMPRYPKRARRTL